MSIEPIRNEVTEDEQPRFERETLKDLTPPAELAWNVRGGDCGTGTCGAHSF